jgi:two-component system, sensor histidine kinase
MRRNPLTKRQATTILVGLSFPIVGNVMGLMGIQPIPGVDLTPMMFALSAVLSADGVFRWSLLTVAPIARDKVVDDLADGIVVLDPDFKVIDANPAASRILGIDPNLMTRSTPSDWEFPLEIETVEAESFVEVESRTYFMRRTYLTGAGSGPVGIILQLTDVTEQKRTQEELRQATEAAEVASAVKTRFVANISHELRTPLNGVIGLSDLLNTTTLNKQQQDYLEGIRQCSNTLLGLISDVLDFSKLDADAMQISQVPVDVASIIQEVATVHRFLAVKKELDFRIDIQDLPKYVLGDPLRIRQILHNLVGNATKFTERGGITVSVRVPMNRTFQIFVSDTGIGIPHGMQNAVFEAFQQAEVSTARRFGGTGLGLPITRGLVDRMGGSITLESSEGVGTTICITLPLVVASVEEVAAENNEVPSGLRVLVAEDNEVNTLVITAMLERLGCDYEHCENGRDAVSAFERSEFDVVLLDIQMPVMDGLEACLEIRSRWPDRQVPIYALTANAFEGERKRASDAGMNGFLTKPIRATDLAQALRSGIRSPQTA